MRKAIVCIFVFCLLLGQLAIPQALAWDPPTPTQSPAVYLVNEDTGTVVYQKNANQKMYPASITKLMTAVLTMQKFEKNLNQVVTVTHADIDPLSMTDSSIADLRDGEQVTVEQLLYCLMLPSANDAANVLARVTGGTVDHFVEMMNAEAKKIGAKSTHYVNPHGLQDPDQYTTAYDTYLIAKTAMKFPELRTIVSQSTYTIPQTNAHAQRVLVNTNDLLRVSSGNYYSYAKGIKTGSTTDAGSNLVSYAKKGNYTYYCVVLGGPKNTDGSYTSAFSDSKALYTWAFGNFSLTPLLDPNQPLKEIKVNFAWNKSSVLLMPDNQLNALAPNNLSSKNITSAIHVPDSVDAPVTKGQKVGTADILVDGAKVGRVNLVAASSIPRSNSLYFVHVVQVFFRSILFKIVAVALVLGLIAYVVLSYYYNRRKKKMRLNRRRKNYRLPR